MAVGMGRLAACALLLSLIAYIGCQFPSLATIMHLESWNSQSGLQNLLSFSKQAAPPDVLNPIKSKIETQLQNSTGRVAVCLVGAARAFELTGKTLQKYVLDVYNDTDIFLHSPVDKDTHKFTLLKGSSRLAMARIFISQNLPESNLQREVLSGANSPNGIQGLLQYFQLVEGCLDMIQKRENELKIKYDWIVRTRVDGYWSGPLPAMASLNSSEYHVPAGSQFGGLNDRFGVGNLRTSQVALSRLRLLPLMHAKGKRNLNSETAFKVQLEVSEVPVSLDHFPFCILTYRKYHWPPEYWGVPVAALTAKGPLNGAKCRPCTPKATGADAQAIIDKLNKGWGYPGYIEGLELCDARGEWEQDWEKIYETTSGLRISSDEETVTTRSVSECVKDVEEFQQLWEVWDAPPAKLICTYGRLGT